MPEARLEKPITREELSDLRFEGKKLKDKKELKEAAGDVLATILSTPGLDSSEVIKFLVLTEAINEGKPAVFPEGESARRVPKEIQVDILTPLTSDLKTEEVIEQFKDRWRYPEEGFPPDSACLVVYVGPYIEGKSRQKFFIVLGSAGGAHCYHYGISEKPMNRRDGYFRHEADLEANAIKGMLLALARGSDIARPSKIPNRLDRPITDFLPSHPEDIRQS